MNWDEFWSVVYEYKDIIASAVSLLFVIVFGIINKKRVKVGDVPWTDCLLKLPGWINDAESSGYKGDGKLQYVVAEALKFLSDYYGDVVFGDKLLIRQVIAAIENILSTPTKK